MPWSRIVDLAAVGRIRAESGNVDGRLSDYHRDDVSCFGEDRRSDPDQRVLLHKIVDPFSGRQETRGAAIRDGIIPRPEDEFGTTRGSCARLPRKESLGPRSP